MLNLIACACLSISRSTSPVADLIRAESKNWEVGPHWITHSHSGIKVWIANSIYGLHVEGSGDNMDHDWKPGWAERRLIWSAYKQAIAIRAITHERKINRTIQRYLDRETA